MNRTLVWIGAAVLAVGPLTLVGAMRPAAMNQTAAKPVSTYVLMDGPVAASTDDVVAVAASDDAVLEVGNGGGTVTTSLAWTGAAGVLVLVAWAAVAAGDAVASRTRTAPGDDGARRIARRAWRFAVPGAARWGLVVRVGE